MLAKLTGGNICLGKQPDQLSRIVITEHYQATDGASIVNADIVKSMIDESMKELTGISDAADAWHSILPDFKENHLVAIKVNPLALTIPTRPEVVDAILSGLTAAGVRENNIIIYDKRTRYLKATSYRVNASEIGVRCFGTDTEGWGYGRSYS